MDEFKIPHIINVEDEPLRSALTCMTVQESKLCAKIHKIEDIFKYIPDFKSIFRLVDGTVIYTVEHDLSDLDEHNRIIVSDNYMIVNCTYFNSLEETFIFDDNAVYISIPPPRDQFVDCKLIIAQTYDLQKTLIRHHNETLLQHNENKINVNLIDNADRCDYDEHATRIIINTDEVNYNVNDGFITSEKVKVICDEFMLLYPKLMELSKTIRNADGGILNIVFPKDYGYEDRKITIHKCCVCLLMESVIVFVPCGHLVVCFNCALSVDKCPICRQSITNKITVYT